MFEKKILLVFTFIYFAIFGVAGYTVYEDDKRITTKLIDSKLLEGANALPFILKENYHNKNLSPQTLSKAEDLKNIKKLSAYVNQTDLEYIYSFIIDKKGHVRFASSSAKQEDVDANKSDIYSFDEYDDPDVIKAIETKKAVFSTTSDKWGTFRSVYVPKVSSDGRDYVVGADCDLYNVESIFDMLLKNSKTVFSVLVSIALLYFAIIYYTMRYFSKVIKEKEKELVNMYERDTLTNLFNRMKLIKDLSRHPSAELILFDINGFKLINAAYGITFGDRCLVLVAEKLREIYSEQLSIYKLEGDRFCVMYLESDSANMLKKAHNVIEKLEEQKYVVNGYGVYLNFFAGLSSEIEGDNKLLAAEIALKAAKESRQKVLVYSKEMSIRYSKEGKRDVVDDIYHAIDHDGILAYFQPIYDVASKKIIKYESLMRLKKRDASIVVPYYFMQISQKAQLYPKIASIMFEKVIQKAKEHKEIEFSMNLSSLDIENPSISENILKRIEEEGLNKQITLEILESEAFGDYGNLINFAKKARSLGVKLSLDDFGSGYSNLANLAEVHFQYIKIDGSLVKDVLNNKSYESIIEIIVTIAKQFHSETIAEFVENEAIAKKLVELGVDKLQGYYIGKPEADIL